MEFKTFVCFPKSSLPFPFPRNISIPTSLKPQLSTVHICCVFTSKLFLLELVLDVNERFTF